MEYALAGVIDGQHRLFAFAIAGEKDPLLLNTELICSVFIDLPKPFQAQLFATINSTQKPVDKSLTYELFGYNISEETEDYWSPDKLAVFLARKLNSESESSLKDRIIIAPQNEIEEGRLGKTGTLDWKLSMATIVEGILRLISSNPKRDTAELMTPKQQTRSILLDSNRKDRSPLRNLYVEGNDQLLYLLVRNFLSAANQVLWTKANKGSFIIKTVGIQALLDILRKLCVEALEKKDISVDYFVIRISPVASIDFGHESFRDASGSGRGRIRRFIEAKIGLLKLDTLSPEDELHELVAKFQNS